MRRLMFFAGLLCLFAFQATAQTKLIEKVERKGSEIVIPYQKFELQNGLTLIVHEDHSDPVVHVDVTYHVGSAREEIGKSGFAHFFEHMMFQGSDNVADEQHFKIVTESGGTLNGSTNRDRTNYYETVPVNQLEKMLWLEADRMGFLLDAVTQKKFEVQRSTVKNERGQNYDNRPYGLVSEYASKSLYPYGHPYSWMTIGYIEDLNRVNVDDLKNFFLRWYGPNNATVTIGGDVRTNEVVKLVEKYFGSIPRGPEVNKVEVEPVQISQDRYVSFVDNYARLPLLSMSYPTVPNYHPDMAALSCLAQIIGQGKTSLLYQHLEKPGLALQADLYSSYSELAGELSFRIIPMQGKSLAEMEKLVRASLDSFETRGVTNDDIEKFKGAIQANLINGLQSVAGKVSQLAAFETFTGNPNKISDLLKMYNSVTKEDVQRVYDTYVKGKKAVILSVLPKGQESLVAAKDNYTIDTTNYKRPDYGYAGLKYSKAKDNFERKKMPGNGPNPVIKVPSFWRKDLANGIRVIGSESNELPTVTMTLTLKGGHLLQANDTSKVGLAELFATMMNDDTKNYTAEQMAIELQKLGSSINVRSDVDGIIFSVQSLKSNFDKTMTLLEERLFRPAFKESAFNRFQKQTIESIKLDKTRPASVANAVFAKIVYGPGNILGMDQAGNEFSVKNISIKDIEHYYQNYISSQDAKLVVVGDIKQEEFLKKVSFLSKLPNKKVELPKVQQTPVPVSANRAFVVDVPKSAQTEFRIGYGNGMKYDATGNYYRSILTNFPLGGDFNARVNLNLREDKGWTYGARTGFSSDKYGGTFSFSSGIRANATDSALVEVLKDLRDYSSKGITNEELAFMKSAMGQRDALRYETGFQKAGFISRILDYNLPANYVEQQNKIMKTITKKEIDAIAKAHIDPAKMHILLVGDKAKITTGLEKLGYSIEVLNSEGDSVSKKGF